MPEKCTDNFLGKRLLPNIFVITLFNFMKFSLTQVKKIVNKILGRYKEARRYSQLSDVIREIRPKTIMEIGTWSGKRAEAMIQLAQSLCPDEEISYFGFDLFEDLTPDLYAKEIS